jgi:NADH-quinone oxidoreductase subunit L
MTGVLVLLALFAVFGGILFLLAFGGPSGFVHADVATEAAVGATSPHPDTTGAAALVAPFSAWQTWVALGAMVVGLGIAWFLYRPSEVENHLHPDEAYTGIAGLLYRRYRIDEVYDGFADVVVVGFARVERWYDENVIDGAVNGIGWAAAWFARVGRRMQTGNAQDYATVLLAGLIVFILIVIYVPEANALLPNFWNNLPAVPFVLPFGGF